ncbi:MAG: hypothetical protein AAF658_09200, partial [Myxococcota bacterium]
TPWMRLGERLEQLSELPHALRVNAGLLTQTKVAYAKTDFVQRLPSSFPGRERYGAVASNHTSMARMLLDPNAKKVVFGLHGLGQGSHLDGMAFHTDLWARQGFNVVLPVRPYHDQRKHPDAKLNGDRSLGPLPTDLLYHNLQTVYEARQWLNWYRKEFEPELVVFVGQSYGALSCQLLLGVEEVDAMVLMVPPWDLGEAFEQGPFEGFPPDAIANLVDITKPISPSTYRSTLDPDALAMVAGKVDAITGAAAAVQVAEHHAIEPQLQSWIDAAHLGALVHPRTRNFLEARMRDWSDRAGA